jgi:hypothetical protein
MRSVEIVLAILFALAGLRSLVHWFHRPWVGEDRTDDVLFILFVVGRVGAWWSLAGLFAIYAAISGEVTGQAFTDEVRARFWWYPIVVLAFIVLQLVAGILLGRRRTAP